MITVPMDFKPRDYQLKLFQAMEGKPGKPETKKRRAILRWHRRAGKDKACFCWLVKEAYQVAGNYFYIFPTREMAKRSLWENIDKDGKKVTDHLPEQVITRFSNQEMMIEIKTVDNRTSTIRVVGFDKDPDSLRGISCKGAVLSEWAFSDPSILSILMPSIMESQGWVIINSTPNGRNHFYDLWMNVKDSDKWYVSELQTMWSDRPNYSGDRSPEELKELVANGIQVADDVEREYGVSFDTEMKGSIYSTELDKARADGRIATFHYDSTKPVDTYWDLGAGDETAIWFAQTTGNITTYIDFWEKNKSGTDDLARMLKTKGYEYRSHFLPHDAGHHKQQRSAARSIEEDLNESLNDFRVTGDVCVIAKTSNKQSSIVNVRKRFALYQFDSLACVQGLRHIELYHRTYDKKRDVYSAEPYHDEHSNAADALRMESESQDYRHLDRSMIVQQYSKDDYDPWNF